MRWWVIGGVVAALVVALAAVPLLPAASVAEAPLAHTWTFDEPDTGTCVEVTVDATLTGREVRPAIGALPWRRWAGTTLVDPEVRAFVPAGCEPGEGELVRLDAHVVVGSLECQDWPGYDDLFDDLSHLPAAAHMSGCGGDTVWLAVATDRPVERASLAVALVPDELHTDARGCVDVVAAADVQVVRGEGAGSHGLGSPDDAVRVCLVPAA